MTWEAVGQYIWARFASVLGEDSPPTSKEEVIDWLDAVGRRIFKDGEFAAQLQKLENSLESTNRLYNFEKSRATNAVNESRRLREELDSFIAEVDGVDVASLKQRLQKIEEHLGQKKVERILNGAPSRSLSISRERKISLDD